MIVLDTCTLLYHSLWPEKMTARAKRAIAAIEDSHKLAIADISLWEIAMLIQKKRLNVPISYQQLIKLIFAAHKPKVIAISPDIAELSTSFSGQFSADPADRLIAATTIVNKATLITSDNNLLTSEELDTIW